MVDNLRVPATLVRSLAFNRFVKAEHDQWEHAREVTDVRVLNKQASFMSRQPQLIRQPAAKEGFWRPQLQAAWPTHLESALTAQQRIVARHLNGAHGCQVLHDAGKQYRCNMPVPPALQER